MLYGKESDHSNASIVITSGTYVPNLGIQVSCETQFSNYKNTLTKDLILCEVKCSTSKRFFENVKNSSNAFFPEFREI